MIPDVRMPDARKQDDEIETSTQMHIRCTDDELKMWRGLAEQSRMSLSAYVRNVLNDASDFGDETEPT